MALVKSGKWLAWCFFGVALLVNPQLACSSNDEGEFSYDEGDMKAAILGEWAGVADLDGESVHFTLTLEQASSALSTKAPSVRPQCASRSFVKPAGACVTMSQMPLAGAITSSSPSLDGVVSGQLIASRLLEPSRLELQLEDGRTMSGELSAGKVRDGQVWASAQVGTFSLSRP